MCFPWRHWPHAWYCCIEWMEPSIVCQKNWNRSIDLSSYLCSCIHLVICLCGHPLPPTPNMISGQFMHFWATFIFRNKNQIFFLLFTSKFFFHFYLLCHFWIFHVIWSTLQILVKFFSTPSQKKFAVGEAWCDTILPSILGFVHVFCQNLCAHSLIRTTVPVVHRANSPVHAFQYGTGMWNDLPPIPSPTFELGGTIGNVPRPWRNKCFGWVLNARLQFFFQIEFLSQTILYFCFFSGQSVLPSSIQSGSSYVWSALQFRVPVGQGKRFILSALSKVEKTSVSFFAINVAFAFATDMWRAWLLSALYQRN